MEVGRKGIFFVAASLLLVTLIAVLLAFRSSPVADTGSFVVQNRVLSINNFIQTVDNDIQRGVFIAGFRGVVSLTQYVTSTGLYLNSTQEQFREVFLDGTLFGDPQPLMQDSSFSDWASRISSEADKIGISAEFQVQDVQIYPVNPWLVEVNISVLAEYRDATNLAAWRQVKRSTALVNITGFEDVSFSVGSFGRLARVVNQTPYEGNYVQGTDTSNLRQHILYGLYAASNSSPSFLMRLGGNFSGSPYGIESFVYIPDFQAQEIPTYELVRSSIDYLYFSNVTGLQLNKINNTFESWLRIDDAHLQKYQVQSLVVP
ncbi:hypothetical protein J4475_00750 [Candidatus Woesearchaeota archaeon]|nr:hypothetical protein [Candidatus Woesearchaeota archaeon]